MTATITTAQPMATDRQIAYIKDLFAGKDLSDLDQVAVRTMKNVFFDGSLPRKAASNLIDILKRLPWMPRESKSLTDPADIPADAEVAAQENLDQAEAPASKTAPEGMHRLGDFIYKVQVAVHGSGRLYAKRLTPTRECEGHPNLTDETFYCDGMCRPESEIVWKFEYAPGVISRLSEDTLMTFEEAKAFGAVYGTCCVCGRTLTDENSIEAGIGPICAKKF